ncbi:cell wall/surface repeat-containing protein,Internalin-A precursor,repeat,Listeria-Bacteroides repeat domain (List_Bact_rpt) [[Clostridium] sordellii]|nr:cell wall/surface repeat-containing protein,Internalin-A precursor,repeat,Listeria-Bacteroides repeat domain (List_Bact_rpt) [[Clostridium] sordellii] [Paeniclostridium sordellii]
MTYDSNGGTSVPQESVDYNAKVSRPTEPTKEGYTFAGWYTDETFKTEWNFDTDKMPSKDITLYAKWNVNNYNVTYDSNGGTSVPQESVDYNAKVSRPTNPTKEGYTFAGWYTDKTFKTEWNFNTDKMPSKDITLYAKWNVNNYNVTYDSNGGTSVPQESVDYNAKVSRPTNPTKEGYTFAGWYTDKTFKTEWNFDTDKMPSKDITLYAKWTLKWSGMNNAPVINVENKTIKVGDKFNPMEGVTATDKENGNLTNDIKIIENTVDTSKPGTYTVKYEITDKQGAKSTKTITVTVINDTIENSTNNNTSTGSKPSSNQNNIAGNNETTMNKPTNSQQINQAVSNNNANPKTGDAGVLGYLGVGLASLTGLFINRKKKNENND